MVLKANFTSGNSGLIKKPKIPANIKLVVIFGPSISESKFSLKPHNQRQRYLQCLEIQGVSDMHIIGESKRPALNRKGLDQISREPPDVLFRTPGAKL